MQLPPPVHGVTVVNQCVAQSTLLSSQFDIQLLPLAFAPRFEDLDRVSIRKLGRVMTTAVQLAFALVARRPDAVYFTLTPTGAAFYRDCLFVGIMKLSGVRRIFHLHARTGRVTGWRRALYRWAFRDASVIHVAARLAVELDSFVPAERVFVVPNGVAERPLRMRARRTTRLRLLYLSNLTESKGPLVLIEALAMLRARGIAFEATFAGAVHDNDFLARWYAALRRHRLDEHVRYVGPAYDETKDRLYGEHDIFVLPTSKDAFPLVALEAMQAGLPVVSTCEGAIPDIVCDGETGLLAPSGNPEALANCLARLATDSDMRHRMGEQGRVRWRRAYTDEIFEHELAATLARCMKHHTAAGGAR